jgi:hypothetical protein
VAALLHVFLTPALDIGLGQLQASTSLFVGVDRKQGGCLSQSGRLAFTRIGAWNAQTLNLLPDYYTDSANLAVSTLGIN